MGVMEGRHSFKPTGKVGGHSGNQGRYGKLWNQDVGCSVFPCVGDGSSEWQALRQFFSTFLKAGIS